MQTFPYLDLELNPAPFASRRKGLVMLVTGAVLLLSAVTQYVLLRQKIDAIEQSRSENSTDQIKRVKPVSNNEIKAINGSIEQISLPWSALFVALEGVKASDVNLLSVEPDAQKTSVKIVAEAPDVYGMLEYQRELSAQKGLSDVSLVQYEMQTADNAQPVRFTLNANWGAAR